MRIEPAPTRDQRILTFLFGAVCLFLGCVFGLLTVAGLTGILGALAAIVLWYSGFALILSSLFWRTVTLGQLVGGHLVLHSILRLFGLHK